MAFITVSGLWDTLRREFASTEVSMPIDNGRVILGGTVSSGADRWSMSFATNSLSGLTTIQLNDLATLVSASFDVNVWSGTSLSNDISDNTAWDSTIVQDRDAANHVLRTATVTVGGGGSPGGTSVDQLPPEVAEVISLRTDFSGPQRRGRMYFPPLAISAVDPNGYLTVAAQSELVGRFQAFFNDILTSNAAAKVYSSVGSHITPVTSIGVGRVFDSQRRRRNQMAEAYDVAVIS